MNTHGFETRRMAGARTRVRMAGLALLAGALGLAWTGCSLPLPQAQVDPTKIYVLTAPSVEAGTLPPETTRAKGIRLRPVEMANYLRAQAMIVRKGQNELEFREFARWGEPLEQGIARVLREELLAKGAAAAVQIGAMRSSPAVEIEYELIVRVLTAEGTSDGRVNFAATWELATAGAEPKVVQRGRYRAADLSWRPTQEATLAAALSQAVAGLAAEISEAIGNH